MKKTKWKIYLEEEVRQYYNKGITHFYLVDEPTPPYRKFEFITTYKQEISSDEKICLVVLRDVITKKITKHRPDKLFTKHYIPYRGEERIFIHE